MLAIEEVLGMRADSEGNNFVTRSNVYCREDKACGMHVQLQLEHGRVYA